MKHASLWGILLILTLAISQSIPVLARPAAYTPPVTNRVELIFNTDWRYNQGDVSGAQAIAFNDSAWTYVDLPHTTKFVTPESITAYLGISWYRKHFTVDSAYQGRKLYVEFEAAMQVADVWVNGVSVAHHEGGYAPFTIDLTNAVTYGGADNVIAVKLNSNANANWAPGWNGVDFQYHGGLYRDVKLYVTDKLHVTDAVFANVVAGGGIFVTYPSVSSSSATVNILTHVINENTAAKSTTVLSEIVDAAGNVVGSATTTNSINASASLTFNQNIIISNPALWHPNTPNLYTLHTTVKDGATAVDYSKTRIGIRSIGWSHNNGLSVNGVRYKALGTNYHQEIYGLGNAVPNQSIYYDLKRIKEGGQNWIRGAHYPHDPAFYEAADELGILVMDEQTGWQQYNNTTAFNNNTYQELRDMIRRDRNHPSVVAWEASLNESNFTDAWALQTHNIVHQEYPGNQAFSAQWMWSRADIFIGASQAGVRTSTDTRPIIISEYGDWDYGGANSTSRQKREDGDNAMLTQANNIQDGLSKNLALSWFSADGYWDYADYGGFTSYGITRSGSVDMYRLPKHSYYFFQSQRDPNVIINGLNTGPMVYIANQWTSTSPTTVRVYSNCTQVSLYLNGNLVSTRSPDTGTNLLHPPFNFNLGTFTAGTLRADCLINSVVQASFTRQTPGTATALRLRPEATTLQANLSDARLVFIDVLDANGNVVPTDSHVVNLSLSGPGSIVGPASVTMKGGQLATWVRSGRTGGTITLTASSSGLTSANVNLTSQTVPGLPPCPVDRCGGPTNTPTITNTPGGPTDTPTPTPTGNKVVNPGFETGSLSPWTAWNSASVVASNTHSGTYALQIAGTTAGSGEQAISGLTPNTSYTLIGWAKVSAAGVEARIGVKNFGGTEINQAVTSTTYGQATVNFTTGASNTTATIYCWKPTTTGTIYCDDFSVVANGPTPTPTRTNTPGPTNTPTRTPTPGGSTNLALGKTASADSAQTANPAANGNDGSTTTRWCANDGNLNHWWKVDLGASHPLTGSEVMWEFSGRVYKYKVEVSTDNTNWTMVVDKTNNTSTAQTQTDNFTATARYVRITVTGLQASPVTWASFFEFRVFGS